MKRLITGALFGIAVGVAVMSVRRDGDEFKSLPPLDMSWGDPQEEEVKRIKNATWATRRKKVVTSIVTFALVIAGSAFAAWLVTRSSSNGKGAVGTLTAPTMSAGTVASGTALLPDGAGDLTFSVHNPNSVRLHITGWADGSGPPVGVGDIASAASHPNCNSNAATYFQQYDTGAGNASYGGSGVTGLNILVPVGDSQVTVPNVIFLSSSADTDCQGATFMTETPAYVWHFSS